MGTNSYSKSVFVLRLLTGEAKIWAKENLDYEEWQIVGEGISIDIRYIEQIVVAMQETGLKEGEDFKVF